MDVRCETGHMWPTMGHDHGCESESPPKARGRHGCERPGEGQADTAGKAISGFPIGDLRPWLPAQLERDIYEHTPDGAECPMWAHETPGGPARHLSVRWVAARAACNLDDARKLADCLAILDADERLSREVCRWAYARGTAATLRYLEPLCMAAAEAETVNPEDCTEQPGGAWELQPTGAGKPGELNEPAWQWQAPLSAPETIAYHRVGDDDEESPDWLERRPWLQATCQTFRDCADLAELKALKKRLYETPMPATWASVAWSFAAAAEARLRARARKARPNLAAALLERIAAAGKRDLPSLGKALYALQTGKANAGRAELAAHWDDLWAAYRERKEALAATG